MKLIITADSALDIPEEMIEEYGIKTIPVMFDIDGELIEDGQITPEQLVEKFYTNKKFAIRTTPATMDEYYCFFTPLAYMGYHIIHLSLGSGMSDCYKNAKEAAAKFEYIHVIDTQNVTIGAVPFILKIQELQSMCKNTEQIAEYLQNEFYKKVHLTALLNTIDFVHIGEGNNQLKNNITSFIMNLFKKKISLVLNREVRKDSLIADRQFNGDYEQAVMQFITYTLSEIPDADRKTAVIGYTSGTDESLIADCQRAVKNIGRFEEVKTVKASCAITSHFGYGCIILCWYDK